MMALQTNQFQSQEIEKNKLLRCETDKMLLRH